ncbi:MAG TPA: hypothetical protein VNH19_05565 [Candidatus Limnocylindrales bacterium]|nr:hypothetical protein [Candidatus Limnocylindrales bacterium]
MKLAIQILLALVVVAGTAWGGLQLVGHKNAKNNVALAEALIRRDRVRTPNEKLEFTSLKATPNGSVCIEFTSQDARPESIRIERAVFDTGGISYVAADEYWAKCRLVSEDFTYKTQ